MKTYRKINLYRRDAATGRKVSVTYICSTNWSKTCKEAKDRYLAAHPHEDALLIRAYFA